jgi:cysteine desulfurase
MHAPVYLDYAATTPVDPSVAQVMMECLTQEGNFGNPASRSHIYGWRAEEAVETARGDVAQLIGADPREVVWTSGATESNNLALKGVAHARTRRGRHIVTSRIEHKAVLDTCGALAQQGFDITYLTPDHDGLIRPEVVFEAVRRDTIAVSLMHVNNELGTVTDIAAIGNFCRQQGIAFHVDAAQSAGKLLLDVHAMNIDLLSISAHKMYGPKGIGALYVRRSPDVRIAPQIHGGGHERGMRSGTLPTHQIVGLGAAAKLALDLMAEEQARIEQLRAQFLRSLGDLAGLTINGSQEQRIAGIVNLAFADVDGESLLMALRELALSSGSACTSASVEPSYVLTAIGVSEEVAHSSLRFSFGRYTTSDHIQFAAEKVKNAVAALRRSAARSL